VLDRALARLYARIPLGMRLGLEPMRQACARFGHPERAFEAVHVAGTNGKGSVCAMVESIARAAGRRTGMFTSPHLCRFAERIQIAGQPIDDATLTVEPDGPIGSVGLHWTPGPRTSVILNFNHRYDDNFVTGNASYQIGPKTNVAASYTERIETSQTLFANDLNFLITDEFGNFIDARTAQLFALGGSAFGLTDQAFKLKRFETNLHAVRGRNTFDVIGYYETRDVESTDEFDTAGGGELNWGRALSRLTNLNLTFRFRDADFDVPGAPESQQIVGAGTSLIYHMNETLDGVVSLEYTRQFSNVPDDEFSEAVISFGLAKRF